MSHDYNRRFRGPKIVVRETDDYVNSRHPEPSPEPANPWIRNLFHPVAFTILVACMLWPIAQFVSGLSPILSRTVIWLIPILMALVGFTTERTTIQRLLSGSDALRFRLIELGVLLLVAKIAGHLDDTLPELVSIAQTWSETPLSFFDAETMTAFVLGLAVWFGGSATARDLDAVADPSLAMGETNPRRRLANRYFLGGVALMVSAALNRVDVYSVVTMTQARTRAPIVSALIYFLLGLVMLGQIRFSRLASLWHRDKVTVSANLNRSWLRYLLVFLGLMAGIAFALPTGYTLGFLDLIAFIISLILSLMMILYMLITWPLALLAALLLGKSEPVPPPAMDRLPLKPEIIAKASNTAPWWAFLRSAIFWSVLLTAIVTLVRSYIRDRPELRQLLQSVKPLRWANQLWHAFRNWLKRLGQTAGSVVPDLIARIRERSASRKTKRAGDAPLSSRERMHRLYMRTLEAAREAGMPRRRTQTPHEYRRHLQPHIEEEKSALEALTEAFIEARYSTHPISPDDVAEQQSNAEQIQRSLQERTDD